MATQTRAERKRSARLSPPPCVAPYQTLPLTRPPPIQDAPSPPPAPPPPHTASLPTLTGTALTPTALRIKTKTRHPGKQDPCHEEHPRRPAHEAV